MALNEGNAETDSGGGAGEAGNDAGNAGEGAGASAGAEPIERPRVPIKEKAPRRQKAANDDAVSAKLKKFEENWTKEKQEWQGQSSQYNAEINRLRGQLEEIGRRGDAQAPRGPNPDELMAEAEKALAEGKYSDWQKKFSEAMQHKMMSNIPWHQLAPQRQQASTDPRLQIVMNQNPEVMLHQNGYQMAVLEDQKLALQGYQDGPERWSKAFQIVGNALGGRAQQPAQFSQQGRAALAGIPTQQQNGQNGGGKFVELTPDEEMWRKAAGMSRDEYVLEILKAHPDRARAD